MKNRVQGAEGSRIQVKGVEVKTLEPSNPGILEPWFRINPTCALWGATKDENAF